MAPPYYWAVRCTIQQSLQLRKRQASLHLEFPLTDFLRLRNSGKTDDAKKDDSWSWSKIKLNDMACSDLEKTPTKIWFSVKKTSRL